MQRKSNIELLRILAMLMIIGLHYFAYLDASVLFNNINSINSQFYRFAESICICGVDIFILISGWFLTDRLSVNIRKLVNLIIQVAFWSVIGYFIMFFTGMVSFDVKEVIKSIFPYFFGMRWFVKSYIVYFLLVPFINSCLVSLNKKTHLILLLISVFLFSIWPSFLPYPPIDDFGYGFVNFIFLHIIISYIRKYLKSFPKKSFCIVGAVFSFFAIFLSNIYGIGYSWAYNYIFVILAALFIFLFFVQIDIKSKIINILASCSFGVFIIHTDPFFSQLVYGKIFNIDFYINGKIEKLIFNFIICLPVFYLLSSIIELIRIKVFDISVNKMLDKVKILNLNISGIEKNNEENFTLKNLILNFYNNVLYPNAKKILFKLKYRFSIMSFKKTIRYINKKNVSIARFGDGEFGIINKSNNPDFQEYNEKLAERLLEVVKSSNKNLLVCLPITFQTTRYCTDAAKEFWDWWIWNDNNLLKIATLLNWNKYEKHIYGNAQITRPYIDWKEKSQAEKRFDMLKTIWEGKDILIIEGLNTKLGVGNDLFDNASSIKRIIVPSKNAFNRYDDILTSAKFYGANKLVLLALGPSATVLAYDLSCFSIQALDIGHIDVEYEWFLKKTTEKIQIKGKEVQELHNNCNLNSEQILINSEYENQIILKIINEEI